MADLTRKQIIAAAKKAAKQVEGPLTLRDFTLITGISRRQVCKTFLEGGWVAVKREAGLKRSGNAPISNEELLRAFHNVAKTIGKIPAWESFHNRTKISRVTLARRFGGMPGTLASYRTWLEANHSDSPLIKQVDERLEQLDQSALCKKRTKRTDIGDRWKRLKRPALGKAFNFRGMQRAPTNEQGVIALFVLIMNDLNIMIDKMRIGFPDCEANRLVDSNENLWQSIRIEFEYYSRAFVEHKHDPAECDMIVCWNHNWPECPLEVLELKSVIKDLTPSF